MCPSSRRKKTIHLHVSDYRNEVFPIPSPPQIAEKERRQRAERERAVREEAALDEHIRRETERERQSVERERLATAERRAAAERRQQLVTEAIRKAEREAAAEKHRRLRGGGEVGREEIGPGGDAATAAAAGGGGGGGAGSLVDAVPGQETGVSGGGGGGGGGGGANESHRRSSRPSGSSSGESESSRPSPPGGRTRLSPLRNRRRSDPSATGDARLGSGREPLPGLGRAYIEDRVLTPTKYRGEGGGSGCEFGTQTDPGRRQRPAELVQRRDVNVGTETPPREGRLRERTKPRARPVKLEDRPRWNAPRVSNDRSGV